MVSWEDHIRLIKLAKMKSNKAYSEGYKYAVPCDVLLTVRYFKTIIEARKYAFKCLEKGEFIVGIYNIKDWSFNGRVSYSRIYSSDVVHYEPYEEFGDSNGPIHVLNKDGTITTRRKISFKR